MDIAHILLILAVLVFIADGLRVRASRVNLQSIGLALLAASLLAGGY